MVASVAAPAALADPPGLLRQLFDAALQVALPARQLAAHLPPPPQRSSPGRTVVVGAGKASAAMAEALEAAWPGVPLEGLVVTRYGHARPCRRLRIVEAAHPVPDAAGLAAAQQMLALVQGLGPQDRVIGLWSGGGSALLPLPLPAAGLSLADLQALNQALLASGASIGEMNGLRRHTSAIQGGRLALACAPAAILNLVISDVPGDDPADVASGPALPDPSRCADALDTLHRWRIEAPAALRAALLSGAAETPKPGDARLPRIDTRLIATPRLALQAAAQAARRARLPAHILGDALEGEARSMGNTLAGLARHIAHHGEPFTRPCVLLSGGEATVQLRGRGRGGRNVEFLLALALALRGEPGVWALAADTDGIDGSEPVAGALCDPDTLRRAEALGLRAGDLLADNDAHHFFEALGDQVVTGPTLTNVNDFRAILVA